MKYSYVKIELTIITLEIDKTHIQFCEKYMTMYLKANMK